MKRVLVAEDDPAIIDALSLILGAEGYDVLTAKNKEQIFQRLEQDPQLVLLDIRLSGTDGAETCQEIKQQEKYADVPVMLMSANPDIETIAQEVGANGYIRKPFEILDSFLHKSDFFHGKQRHNFPTTEKKLWLQ
jgi:CheY-like chemotaxis protein